MNFKDMVKIYLKEAKKKDPNKNFGGGGCDNTPLDQTMYRGNKKNKKQKKNTSSSGGCGGITPSSC